jgi:hypothetical protein
MTDSTNQGQRGDIEGRCISMRVFGDTASELEFAALDEARAVFGEDVRLEIEPSYRINPVAGLLDSKAGGKKYVTTIRVWAH